MFQLHPQARKKNIPGSLGAIVRSTGYLQGGYKGGPATSELQMYNTTTEVGAVIYDTGYARSYVPGASGNLYGYFSINANTDHNRFSYATNTASVSFNVPAYPKTTTTNFGVSTLAWLWCGSDSTAYQGSISSVYRLTANTDTPTNLGNIASAAIATSRQGLSLGQCSSCPNMNNGTMDTLDHTSETVVSSTVSNANITVGVGQIIVGLSRNNSYGFVSGMNGANVKVTYVGSNVSSMQQSTSFTYNFGESHSLSTDVSGYLMAGYSDTTGRYSMAQHGLCQKIVFTTEAIATLPDLAIAQSSGQMMPGF